MANCVYVPSIHLVGKLYDPKFDNDEIVNIIKKDKTPIFNQKIKSISWNTTHQEWEYRFRQDDGTYIYALEHELKRN